MASQYENQIDKLAKQEEAEEARDREAIDELVKAHVALVESSERKKIKADVMERLRQAKEKAAKTTSSCYTTDSCCTTVKKTTLPKKNAECCSSCCCTGNLLP